MGCEFIKAVRSVWQAILRAVLADFPAPSCLNWRVASHKETSPAPSKPYIVGRKAFAAITAVEGLKLSAASENRLIELEQLSAEQRRAEVVRVYRDIKGR